MLHYLNSDYLALDLNLYACGKECCYSCKKIGPKVRDIYLIHYILNGKGSYTLNNKIYTLEKNQGFLISPNTLISYEADKSIPWEYIWVSFQGIKVNEILEKSSLSIENPVFTYSKDNSLLLSMENIISSALSRDDEKELLYTSNLYIFLYKLIKIFPNKKNIYNHTENIFLQNAIKYINANYDSNITINDICKYINIGDSYLHRLFKNNLNTSPKQYLLNLRMNKACFLLNNKSLTIGDISRSVGYQDPLIFSKAFKKIKGMSPSLYRLTHS